MSHPIPPNSTLSTPGSRLLLRTPLFCSSGLLHMSPAWEPSFPFYHRNATPPSRQRCSVTPRAEACSPPCAGVPVTLVPFGGLPTFLPSFCCANAGAPLVCQLCLPRPQPLRSEMGSGARLPMGPTAEKFPCWECTVSTESSLSWGPAGDTSEPRGRECTPRAPAPCPFALSGSSLNTFLKPRRPHRPCLPHGLLTFSYWA